MRETRWSEAKRQLTIAIDFDGTFAENPGAFREVIEVFQARGHRCIMVTNGSEEGGQEVRRLVGDLMPILFAGRFSKAGAVYSHGYDVDIWVDDTPHVIERDGVVYLEGAAWRL